MSHPRLSPAECAALLREQGYAYLDVRNEPEFELEHAQGAYNVPWAGGGPDFLEVVSAAFARDQGLVVACRSGVVSLSAATVLVEAGFSKVVEQRAGHGGRKDAFGRLLEPGWAAAGLPCSSEAEPGHDYEALRDKA